MRTDVEILQSISNNFGSWKRRETDDQPITLLDLKVALHEILPIVTSGYSFDEKNEYVTGLKLSINVEEIESLQKLFDDIFELKHLERLVLYIPPIIDNSDPEKLRGKFTEIAEIPEKISQLKNLKFIWLCGGIRKIPSSILSLNLPINLIESASSGGISSLEEFFSEKTMLTLKEFDREEESKTRVNPEAIRIDSIEQEILSLHGVFLYEITLEEPPIEIVAKGTDAIANYFQELESEEGTPLNEVKVLLVGDGGSGKTSLVKQIFGEQFDANEPQTHGINIRKWEITELNKPNITVNFWDFGGQEIMHATHQFFLSKRSLYILVLDGRKEEDPEYWLQHIESFGGDSPIMIVINKVDEHPGFDVNRRFLIKKYPSIVGFYRISCSKRKGVESFKSQLLEEIQKVKILRTHWPSSWFKVKEKLEKLEKPHISLSEYKKICREENIIEEYQQETLVEFLHDLGVILHFSDIELLDTHVLDPKWVTEAVYRIINSEILAKRKGILALDNLGEALFPPNGAKYHYSTDKHRYIIELMLKFELCYRLGKDAILVPDLLNIQQPEFSFEYEDALNFVFEYTYFPKSIMPRFIVRMHREINIDNRWRTGVVLENKSFSSKALVLADEKAKRIYITVFGKQKRDYFSVIRKTIHDINSSFEKLSVSEFVPIPDFPDILLDYSELLGYEQGNRDSIFIGRLGKEYNVSRLLNGIDRKSDRNKMPQTIINVQGDYLDQSKVTGRNVATSANNPSTYEPAIWEKAIVYIAGFSFISVISFLVIRNEPINDPNFVILIRMILSIVLASFGATIPGMLKVNISRKGLTIRAIGALALFVITYLLTPQVIN